MNELEDQCRVCLKNSEWTVPLLYQKDLGYPTIAELIMMCASVQISMDELYPFQICKDCLTNLKTSYEFKRLAEDSDRKLRGVLITGKYISADWIPELLCLNVRKKINITDDTVNSTPDDIIESKVPLSFIKEETLPLKAAENGNNDFVCGICDEAFPSRVLFCRHNRSNHPTKLGIKRKLQNNNKNFNAKPQSRKMTKLLAKACPICNETSSSSQKLNKHFKQCHSTMNCKICGLTLTEITTTKLNRHMESHEIEKQEKKFQCPDCGRQFNNKSNLNAHIRVHLKDQNYSCDKCDMKFYFNHHLRKHKIKNHTTQVSCTCEICGRAFALKKQLIRHQRAHLGKEYLCAECNKCFFTKSELNAHMAHHSGVYLHKCNYCKRHFNRMSSLKKHINQHNDKQPDHFDTALTHKKF